MICYFFLNNFFGVSRKPWLCPFRVPDPTIWPQMLIPVTVLRTQPELARIRVLRSCIPLSLGPNERTARNTYGEHELTSSPYSRKR